LSKWIEGAEYMNCRELGKKVLDLVEGTLSQSETKPLEEHLAGCQRCRTLAASLDALMNEGRMDELTLSPEFWPRLNQRIVESERGGIGRLGHVLAGGLRLRPVAASACLLFGVWAGIQLGSAFSERMQYLESELTAEELEELSPYISVLEDVPHGSLAELVIEQSFQDGRER
jgi:hypothetical protein